MRAFNVLALREAGADIRHMGFEGRAEPLGGKPCRMRVVPR